MRVLVLRVECGESGESEVTVDVKCKTPEQVDDIIAWLKLAKTVQQRWHQIRVVEQAYAVMHGTAIALTDTQPVTIAGAVALLEHFSTMPLDSYCGVVHPDGDDEREYAHHFARNVAEALRAIST